MESQLPNDIPIAYANGDRITGENGQIYYSYFVSNLRWLCGYNNQFISESILKSSDLLKSNPNEFNNLFKENEAVLTENAGRDFVFSTFISENTLKFLDSFYSVQGKFPVYLSDNLDIESNSNFQNFLELINLEKNPKKSNLTEEGWSEKQIQSFFQHYKKQISLFYISPVLLKEGLILSNETVNFIAKYCHKYKIPLIWDESLTCFYRTGTFYFLDQYEIIPDFISINATVYQNKTIHILVVNKRIKRKTKKLIKQLPKKNLAANLILLNAIFEFLNKYKMREYIGDISHRLKHKLLALASNTHGRYEVESKGLLTVLHFSNEKYASRLYLDLKEHRLLCYFNGTSAIILIPQLILSKHSVDLFIQYVNDFFKEGIKIKSENN